MSFEELFNRYQSNNKISLDQLYGILTTMNFTNITNTSVRILSKLIMGIESEEIFFDDFNSLIYSLFNAENDVSKAIFLYFDKNHDGYLTQSQIHQLLCSLGQPVTFQQVLELKLPINVGFEDFRKMLVKIE